MQLKATAARRGTSLKTLLRSAVENELARAAGPRSEPRARFPILDSREPGALNPTNADLEGLLA